MNVMVTNLFIFNSFILIILNQKAPSTQLQGMWGFNLFC
jgi:hypothetical protein